MDSSCALFLVCYIVVSLRLDDIELRLRNMLFVWNNICCFYRGVLMIDVCSKIQIRRFNVDCRRVLIFVFLFIWRNYLIFSQGSFILNNWYLVFVSRYSFLNWLNMLLLFECRNKFQRMRLVLVLLRNLMFVWDNSGILRNNIQGILHTRKNNTLWLILMHNKLASSLRLTNILLGGILPK